MDDLIPSRILFDRAPGLGRPRRLRRFLTVSTTAVICLAGIWALVALSVSHWPLLIADGILMSLAALTLLLVRIGWVQIAIHTLVLGILVWIPLVAAFVSGSGINHDGAVHFWLFVVIVAVHFVLLDAARVVRTFYSAAAICVFVIIEYDLVSLEPDYAFPADERLVTHGLTLGLVMIAIVLIMRTFINDLAEAEMRLRTANLRAQQLLNSILPPTIAREMQARGTTFAERIESCTILFADIVGFTSMAARMSPEALVGLLDNVFARFDALTAAHGLEKIKTIGDGYMVAAGIPLARPDHARAMAALALDMRDAIADFEGLGIRIGLNSGPVIAGIIGRQRFSYDLWGDAVNVASRMESHGANGQIQMTRTTRDLLGEDFAVELRGMIPVKGVGEMEAFLLLRKIPGAG